MDEPEGEAGDIHVYHRICGQPRASMSPKVNLKNKEAFGQHTCGPKLMVDTQGRDARYTGRDEVPVGRALWLGIT